MPVQACSKDGKPGWQFGDSGACYTYEPGDSNASAKAKQNALIQAAAVQSAENVSRLDLTGTRPVLKSDEALLDAAIELAEAAVDILKDMTLSSPLPTGLAPYNLAGQWREYGGTQVHVDGSWRDNSVEGSRETGRVPDAGMGSNAAGGQSPNSSRGSFPTPQRAGAAGIAVVAQNTGRVLLLQRADDPADPASGKWEFPGGHVENEETAWEGAQREWQEELGQKLPAGQIVGHWDATDGMYRGYFYLIDAEAKVDLHAERDEVTNPDDPDGDRIEVVAWWDPSDLYGMPALRDEVRGQLDWGQLKRISQAKKAIAELGALSGYLRHGKPIQKFVPEWLPESELAEIKKGMDAGSTPASACAATKARLLTKSEPPARAMRRARQRDQALATLLTQTASRLGALARQVHTPTGSHLAFVDNAAQVLRDAYVQAYFIGLRHAKRPVEKSAIKQGDETDNWDDLPPDVQDDLNSDVDRQHQFLQGLAQDLAAGLVVSTLASRLDQYSASTVPVYEQGYQDGIAQALTPDSADEEAGGIMATWVTTAEDPCALCEEKNGQVWPMEEAPIPGDGDFGENCIIEGTEVLLPPVSAAYRRWYKGPVVRIRTKQGRELTVTPNHPIATGAGWKKAALLDEGTHLIGSSFVEWSAGCPHVQNVPTFAEQVYRALSQVAITKRKPGLPMDFHGDGLIRCKIERVTLDGYLNFHGVTAFAQPGSQEFLLGMNETWASRSSERHSVLLPGVTVRAAGSFVGGSHLGLTFFGGHEDHAGSASLLGISDPYSHCSQPSLDRSSVNTVTLGKSWRSDSTLVLPTNYDEILSVERISEWRGHVYNFSTKTECFLANGIITHNCEGAMNCRCVLDYEYVPADQMADAIGAPDVQYDYATEVA